ncbi:MAG: DinB family protein [Leptonema sp. (in: bacteria)]
MEINTITIRRMIFDYLQGPQKLEETILGMSEEELFLRPIPEKWTTLEVICHISDMELVYADRIKRILVEENPILTNANENLYAKKLFYHKRKATEEMHFIYSIRNQISKILNNLDISDWFRIGIHSLIGEINLYQIVQNITNHIPHHIQFILEKKKIIKNEK